MQLNTFSRLLLKLLFLYVLFTPAVYALNVVLTVTPTEGPPPLSVQFSAQQTVVSPGEAIYGYQWQVNGPENFVLGGFPSHIITLNKIGQYTVTLTVEETTRGGLGFQSGERISASASQVITVYPSDSSVPIPTTTPTTTTPTPTPNATFTYSPTAPTLNENVILRVNNPSSEVAYTWDVSPPLPGQSLSGIEVTVRFPNAIFYDVTLKANNVPQHSNKAIKVESSDSSSSGGISDFLGKTEGTDSIPPTTTTELDNFELLGEFENVPTSFHGILLNVDKDSSLPNGASFGSSEVVDVEIAFKVAAEHLGKQADLSVAVEYFSPDAEQGQWYLKTRSTVFPFIMWDLATIPPPISVEESVNLSEIQKITVFSGHFKNATGKYNIYFAYSLLDGSGIMVHNFPAMPLSFEVTNPD
jgi:hypothetical protein